MPGETYTFFSGIVLATATGIITTLTATDLRGGRPKVFAALILLGSGYCLWRAGIATANALRTAETLNLADEQPRRREGIVLWAVLGLLAFIVGMAIFVFDILVTDTV